MTIMAMMMMMMMMLMLMKMKNRMVTMNTTRAATATTSRLWFDVHAECVAEARANNVVLDGVRDSVLLVRDDLANDRNDKIDLGTANQTNKE